MTRQDILALAGRVEAGSGCDPELRLAIEEGLGLTLPESRELLTSLDATEALRLRLLPESVVKVEVYVDFWRCDIRKARGDYWERSEAPTEPRARLSAILRAYAEVV